MHTINKDKVKKEIILAREHYKNKLADKVIDIVAEILLNSLEAPKEDKYLKISKEDIKGEFDVDVDKARFFELLEKAIDGEAPKECEHKETHSETSACELCSPSPKQTKCNCASSEDWPNEVSRNCPIHTLAKQSFADLDIQDEGTLETHIDDDAVKKTTYPKLKQTRLEEVRRTLSGRQGPYTALKLEDELYLLSLIDKKNKALDVIVNGQCCDEDCACCEIDANIARKALLND